MTRFYEGITRKSLEHKNAIRSQPIIMFGSPPPAMWTKVVVRPPGNQQLGQRSTLHVHVPAAEPR